MPWLQEATSADPIVLVQDYHFAMLPRMIANALPDATIITFWHIPWPNPEAFAICPWREELLDGLLGSSILGFHTQFHCNNFVDTVDRLLEARVDRETFTVSYRRAPTAVKRYPISIEWPPSASIVANRWSNAGRGPAAPSTAAHHAIAVGVDRLDYTKGIEERFRAVERLLELRPEWVGRFTFVQVAAPTRTRIEQYQRYETRVRAIVDSDQRAIRPGEPPADHPAAVHHEPEQVYEYYRGADICFVSSLHDGMNLVAKEFVAARDDEHGVLVLSQFTGAARELPEAIIVNPYDTDAVRAALQAALTMPEANSAPACGSCGACPGVQRVSVGRPHADRRGGHAPAEPPHQRSALRQLGSRCPGGVGAVGGPMKRKELAPDPDPSWAYFLDIDGTLRDLARGRRGGSGSPEPPPADRDSCSESTGGSVAMITGRSISDVDACSRHPAGRGGAARGRAAQRLRARHPPPVPGPPARRRPGATAGGCRDASGAAPRGQGPLAGAALPPGPAPRRLRPSAGEIARRPARPRDTACNRGSGSWKSAHRNGTRGRRSGSSCRSHHFGGASRCLSAMMRRTSTVSWR